MKAMNAVVENFKETRYLARQFGVALMLCALFLGGCTRFADNSNASATPPAPDAGLILMLVTNEQDVKDPQVTAWVDAASEEGVRLQPITDTQFMTLGAKALGFAGLVLPDQFHRVADHALLNAVRRYTIAGGNTLLVFDFGALEPGPFNRFLYAEPHARMSDLAGVNYILYDDLLDKTTGTGAVVAARTTMRDLLVPPGKSTPYQPARVTPAGAKPAPPAPPGQGPADLHAYSGYIFGNLSYPSFATQGTFDGTELARSPGQGLIAGVRNAGQGKVLFVNLPLTYLKLQTDALPMHGFLRYFAEHVVGMARLSPVPDGIAGMTLNWHLDSLAAQQPSLELEKLGVFDDGPFSIDFTAGPDTIELEDELGWNVDNNPVAQALIRRLDKRGHSLGSHGGWVHDLYGDNATESNQREFLPFLKLNKASMDRVVGRPLRSYSAPQGNNPVWAMDWLEQQGVVSAYFTGHTGMGPTRQYREGSLKNPNMWIFPVTPLGRYAVFEEFAYHQIPQREIISWYHAMIDFTIQKNTTRLIYMHPPWAYEWKTVVLELLSYAKSKGPDRFRWYTTERLADFLTNRRKVTWSEFVEPSGARQFKVRHPVTLKEMVWLLPKSRYPSMPTVTAGVASVSDAADHWAIKAGDGTSLTFIAAPK